MDQKLTLDVAGPALTSEQTEVVQKQLRASLKSSSVAGTADEYQQQAASFAYYAADSSAAALRMHDALYLSTALAGEVGEACNVVKKIARDDQGFPSDARLEDLKSELGDCLWYLSQLALHYGFSLQNIAEENLEKLRLRSAAVKSAATG